MCVSVFVCCASGQVTKNNRGLQNSIKGPYYSGSGASSIQMAVLRPEGIDLGTNEQWLPAFIQGLLAADFSKYSAMGISNRQDADSAASLKKAGADISKAEAGKIGEQINVNRILIGRIRKTSNAEFLLQLSLVDSASGVQQVSYSKTVPALFLRDSSAIHDAAEEILIRLGVELTDAGKEALKQIDPREREGAVALARGLNSEQSGNQIETLSYLYSAVSYNSSLTEAVERLESFNKTFEGGLGDLIKNDIEARNFWKKMIDDFDTFYTNHPPFELVFTPHPALKGIPDYEAAGGATVNLSFNASFRESPELDSMRQVIKTLKNGLARTGKQSEWGFGRWPYSSKVFNGFRTFAFKAELADDKNTSLQTINFTMPGRLLIYRSAIYPDTRQKQELLLNNLKVDSLSSNPTVKIISVDGIDAENSGNDGYVRIVPVEKLPSAYSRNLLVYITRNPFDER